MGKDWGKLSIHFRKVNAGAAPGGLLCEYRGIWGYSDDNCAMDPSLSSLQDMIVTMEEYAVSHNLVFSTDPNPVKCKTKCMAYLKRQGVLLPTWLCVELVSYYGEPEQWRIVSITEVLQMRAGELELPDGWRKEEMQEILEAAYCSWYFYFHCHDVFLYIVH